ncbi:MAG: hypothetical protein PVF49_00240 [Anaerolineales bacterium]|jgi:hypothetical protein
MSSDIVRLIVAVVFIGHGIGHGLGIWAALGNSLTKYHSSSSWLLGRLLGERISRVFMLLLFLAAMVGFVGAGLGLFDWLVSSHVWLNWAVWASILSIAALLLFPKGFPTVIPNVIGALLVDAAVLIMMWWQNWPAALFK